jgi:hypothetical protein
LGFWLLDALLALLVLLEGVSVERIHARVEDADQTLLLSLDERKKHALLKLIHHKRKSKIFPILEKPNGSEVHVEQTPKDRACLESTLPLFSRLESCVFVDVIVLLPVPVCVNVPCAQIHTENVLLPTEVLVDQKVLPAKANADSRVEGRHIIYPELKVKLVVICILFNRMSRNNSGLLRIQRFNPLTIFVHKHISNFVLVIKSEIEPFCLFNVFVQFANGLFLV